ncbi:hypothetical protein HWV62_6867 [Athelia sp. TMB]|nr:hypothetical protein HWV62_6867 [Athelia sp. TMB]
MPYYISEDPSRRHRSLVLAIHLAELAIARRKLLLQLEELDTHTRALQREYNELQNLHAPISSLPDEVLGMIFEQGVLLEELPKSRFAPLVSHITRRWRSIALETPRLWNTIFWDLGHNKFLDHDELDEMEKSLQAALLKKLNKDIDRAQIFLSRSMSAPIDIYIRRLRTEELYHDDLKSQHLVWLFHVHFHRCRRLSVQGGDQWSTEKVLEEICCGSAPLLSSFNFGVSHIHGGEFTLSEAILPCGAPQLTNAQLEWTEISSIPPCSHAFQQLKSLRLIGIDIDEHGHALLADALISMRALDHLELMIFPEWPLHLPALVQPTIRFLHLHILPLDSPDDVVERFRALSVTTLSIDCEDRRCAKDLTVERLPQVAFPSLQHLILVGVKMNRLKLDAIAHRFPEIERLTVQGVDSKVEIGRIFTAMGAQAIEGNLASAADISIRWPKLQTIAVSTINEIPNHAILGSLDSQVAALQEAGISIRKLMLPPALVARASVDMMANLRKLVRVEEFSLDWPTPFEELYDSDIDV